MMPAIAIRPLPLDAAAELANDLGAVAAEYDDARLAKLTTDALHLANAIHDFGELLADLAGVKP